MAPVANKLVVIPEQMVCEYTEGSTLGVGFTEMVMAELPEHTPKVA